jgi:lipopolysaccharide export system protein LptC
MSGELHLPDLPEVPVSLGKDPGAPCRPRLAWRARLGSLAGTALPLFTMAVLAAGTWWLVKNAPQAETARPGQRAPCARLPGGAFHAGAL